LDLQLNGSSVQNLVVPRPEPFMKDTLYTFSNTFTLN